MAEMDKTLYALQLLGRRTTDNAADAGGPVKPYRSSQEWVKPFDLPLPNAAADTQHTASPVSDSPTQPAAPTQTPTGNSPWTDREAFHAQYGNLAYVSADFARRLEALVHQQHQALYETTGMMDEGSYRDLLENPSNSLNKSFAAYAALERGIEK